MSRAVHRAFLGAAARHAARPFLGVLPETAAILGIEAGETSYGDASARVEGLAARYGAAGYGEGHRVGLLLGNRPDFVLHWLALDSLGASVVPINPDLRSAELEYLIGHSEMALAVALPQRADELRAAGAPALCAPGEDPPPAGRLASGGVVDEAALLYTSGTTGRPKGCLLDGDYFLACGAWYRGMGGLCALRDGEERMLTPLPLFHMNAMACSVMAMVATGGCLFLLDRFHPRTWWESVRLSRATCVHYLGVMPAMLMSAPASPADRGHAVRFGFGAGCPKELHAPFEARFGFPLVEAWAMTETGAGGVLTAHVEPRKVGTACFGRPPPEIEVRVLAEDGGEAAPDAPGELLVRRAGPDPRRGFFRGYLKDEAATEAAWAGGWLNTGDVVVRDGDGDLHFLDRRKNVIRRSGENVAAVEVESVLNDHPAVRVAGVAPVPDALRGDEVFALLCPAAPVAAGERAALAEAVTRWCLERLAYHKAPAYVAFVDALPVTSTQKIQRAELRALAERLLDDPATVRTGHLKKRAA